MSETVTIKDVQVITTQPSRARLVIVKLITSEPGLYGLGCATFTQRFHAVVTAIEKHLKPFLIGRDVSRIEEIWQMAMVHNSGMAPFPRTRLRDLPRPAQSAQRLHVSQRSARPRNRYR